jgi:hypothetical protein
MPSVQIQHLHSSVSSLRVYTMSLSHYSPTTVHFLKMIKSTRSITHRRLILLSLFHSNMMLQLQSILLPLGCALLPRARSGLVAPRACSGPMLSRTLAFALLSRPSSKRPEPRRTLSIGSLISIFNPPPRNFSNLTSPRPHRNLEPASWAPHRAR